MKRFQRIVPRLRARRQVLIQYLACILIGSYCLHLILQRDCLEGYRNVKTRISKNFFHIPDDVSCYHEENKYDDLELVKKNSLYIISTSCDSSISLHRACVIEAVLFAHAFLEDVYVFTTKPIKSCLCDEEIIKVLQALPRLHFITIQIDKFVEDTPLNGVFKGDFLKIGGRQEARVAEYLKFAALYKFGGIVVDRDTLVVASVLDLGLNWGARMNGSQLGSAIIAMNKKTSIGRSLILRTMELLKKQSRQEDVDSGLALTEAFRQLCEKDPVAGCSHFLLREAVAFYLYNRSSNYLIFRGQTDGELWSESNRVFGYYVWERTEINLYRGSIYVCVMNNLCPKVSRSYGLLAKDERKLYYKTKG